jgi:hypothetical protein
VFAYLRTNGIEQIHIQGRHRKQIDKERIDRVDDITNGFTVVDDDATTTNMSIAVT